MWLKSISKSQLFVAFLLLCSNVMATSATNMVQMKNQQQTLGQTSTTSTEYKQHSIQQQQQQLQQSSGTATHPDKGIVTSTNSILHASNRGELNTESQALPSAMSSSASTTFAQLPLARYVVHDKEAAMQDILKHFNKENDLNDAYQIFNELKLETHDNSNHDPPTPTQSPSPSSSLITSLSSNLAFPWHLYDRTYAPIPPSPPQMTGLFSHNFNPFETFPSPFSVIPRFLPIMSYPQPVYVPYPLVMTPDIFYPSFSSLSPLNNGYEESMSRGSAGSSSHPGSSQHTSSYSRNSPIYYMRFPPTPYMFLPSLGIGTTTPPSMSGYSNILPYQSSIPSFSPIFNVPINFLANGKPTNIYQMSTPPNEMQNPLQFANIPSSFNTRPPPPPPINPYRPAVSSYNIYNTQPSTGLSSHPSYTNAASSPASNSMPTTFSSFSSPSSLTQHNSKLTALKHPYFFNGRPEDIYILPNNFNPLYSSAESSTFY